MSIRILSITALIFFLASCSSPIVQATPTNTPIITITPESSPTPTATVEPTATLISTSVPAEVTPTWAYKVEAGWKDFGGGYVFVPSAKAIRLWNAEKNAFEDVITTVNITKVINDDEGRLIAIMNTGDAALVRIPETGETFIVDFGGYKKGDIFYQWSKEQQKFEPIALSMPWEEIVKNGTNYLNGGYKKYLNHTGPEFFTDHTGRKVGLDYIREFGDGSKTKWYERPNYKFIPVDTTPIVLGTWRDNGWQFIELGALDANHKPFVWFGVLGAYDKSLKPLDEMGWCHSDTHKPTVDCDYSTTANMDTVARSLSRVIGRQVTANTNYIIFKNFEAFNGFSEEQLHLGAERNSPEKLKLLLDRYAGKKGSVDYIADTPEDLNAVRDWLKIVRVTQLQLFFANN